MSVEISARTFSVRCDTVMEQEAVAKILDFLGYTIDLGHYEHLSKPWTILVTLD